jgi:hypothetical protein
MTVMIKFYDIEQNIGEWYALRATKHATSSKASTVMANIGKAFSPTAIKYATNMATQLITGKAIESNYSNAHMQRGKEQEPLARAMYENDYFYETTNGGFYERGKLGDSPDCLIDDDGIAEIKSVISSTHFDNIKRKNIDPSYKWQCIWHLYCSGRHWLDFISFCSDFPVGKQLYVCTVYADDFKLEFEQLEERSNMFCKLVDKQKDIILNSEYYVDTRNN